MKIKVLLCFCFFVKAVTEAVAFFSLFSLPASDTNLIFTSVSSLNPKKTLSAVFFLSRFLQKLSFSSLTSSDFRFHQCCFFPPFSFHIKKKKI
ncbi:hypothetical protein RIF29_16640 [Crotalaria pallida]|uniref:Uncharacterized protein n=1 Tax=Crotalaria pallida TaxID=3830 RepID=A0AAN9FJ73_CROPI